MYERLNNCQFCGMQALIFELVYETMTKDKHKFEIFIHNYLVSPCTNPSLFRTIIVMLGSTKNVSLKNHNYVRNQPYLFTYI